MDNWKGIDVVTEEMRNLYKDPMGGFYEAIDEEGKRVLLISFFYRKQNKNGSFQKKLSVTYAKAKYCPFTGTKL